MKELVIAPKDNASYVDQFWSGMYGNFLSLAQSEQRLIWNRYSAFLVIQGLIANSTKDLLRTGPGVPIDSFILLATVLVGLVVSWAWHFLNYCGWLNQNIFFQHAAQLRFSHAELDFPTGAFSDLSVMKPSGHVYFVAQLVPISFFLFYDSLAYWIIRNGTTYSGYAVHAAAGLFILGLLALLLPQRFISHRNLA